MFCYIGDNSFKISSDLGFLIVYYIIYSLYNTQHTKFNRKIVQYPLNTRSRLSYVFSYIWHFNPPNNSKGNLVYNKLFLFNQIIKSTTKIWMKLQSCVFFIDTFWHSAKLKILLDEVNILVHQSLICYDIVLYILLTMTFSLGHNTSLS